MSDRVTIWDEKAPWASIAHAVEWCNGVPRVVGVPGPAPAPSFSVDGAEVTIRSVEDLGGVVCWGHQPVDPDMKALWLARARRGGP